MSLQRAGQIVEHAARLLTAGLHDRENSGDEAAAMSALCPKRQLSPDHRVPQGALAGIVRRLDTFDLQEGPKPSAMLVQFLAHAIDGGIATPQYAQQALFHATADRPHQTWQTDVGDRAIAT